MTLASRLLDTRPNPLTPTVPAAVYAARNRPEGHYPPEAAHYARVRGWWVITTVHDDDATEALPWRPGWQDSLALVQQAQIRCLVIGAPFMVATSPGQYLEVLSGLRRHRVWVASPTPDWPNNCWQQPMPRGPAAEPAGVGLPIRPSSRACSRLSPLSCGGSP